MKYGNESRWYFLLILLLVGISFYFYKDTIALFPSHIHAWTQSDRLALAWCFMDNGFNFFLPCTYNLETLDGITGVDFPIVEYLAALIMQLLGTKAPVIFRLLLLGIALAGYGFLFRFGKLLTADPVKSLLLVIFAFTCPVLSYYQAGFIPSITAFSCCLSAYFYYSKYLKEGNSRGFHRAILFFVLAALIRKPFIFILLAIVLQQLFIQGKERKFNRSLWWSPLIGLALIGLYFGYNLYLNDTYGARFLSRITPASSIDELKGILKEVSRRWSFQYFTFYHYLLLLSALALNLWAKFRKRAINSPVWQKRMLHHAVLILIFGLFYFLLMARQYVDHEYYFIDSFYLGIIILLALGLVNIKVKTPFIIIAAFLMLGASYHSKKVQGEKYAYASWDRGELTRKNFTGADVYLDSLGIGRDQKILVLDAYSTNTPLLLMDRKGYALVRNNKEDIMEALNLDFDYIVLQDVFIPSEIINIYPALLFRLKRLGGNGKISVFKLMEPNPEHKIEDLLGINTVVYRSDITDPLKALSDWSNLNQNKTKISQDSCWLLSNEDEFGPTFKKSFSTNYPAKLLIKGAFSFFEAPTRTFLVCSASKNGASIYYESYPLAERANIRFVEQYFHFVLPFQYDEITVYVWKRASGGICIKKLEMLLYE